MILFKIDQYVYRLEQTCIACPEQYDMFDSNDQNVGYFRLRHGNFTVSCNNKLLYEKSIGDNWTGIFTDDERLTELTAGVNAAHEFIITSKPI